MGLLPKKKKKISAAKMKRIKTVFGADVKFDEKGHPIEQGIGSPGNQPMSHWLALEKTARIDVKYNPTDENKKALEEAQSLRIKAAEEYAATEMEGDEDDNDEEEEFA